MAWRRGGETTMYQTAENAGRILKLRMVLMGEMAI
jgi:hypothetical protein